MRGSILLFRRLALFCQKVEFSCLKSTIQLNLFGHFKKEKIADGSIDLRLISRCNFVGPGYPPRRWGFLDGGVGRKCNRILCPPPDREGVC